MFLLLMFAEHDYHALVGPKNSITYDIVSIDENSFKKLNAGQWQKLFRSLIKTGHDGFGGAL